MSETVEFVSLSVFGGFPKIKDTVKSHAEDHATRSPTLESEGIDGKMKASSKISIYPKIAKVPCFVMNEHPIARMELSIGRIETIACYLSFPQVSGSLYMTFSRLILGPRWDFIL